MIQKLDSLFQKINSMLIGIMMGLMFIIVFVNVITRYIFSYSFSWMEELSRILMIGICLIGAGLALREHRHVSIELVIDLIKNEKLNKLLRTINALIIIGFMGLLAYLGFMYSLGTMGQKSLVLRWNMGIVYLLIPVGAVVFIMHLLLMFKDIIKPSSIEDFPEQEKRD
ncbi:TRAP transporter small permease [Sporosarcina sp. 179-K 8C2 HS]|uniref:TRAP transporter small permease n=1 Tax=Sporosarcina sp. 179-K 8C2 HS TaxID=3142387 RepID=UPI0039A2757C